MPNYADIVKSTNPAANGGGYKNVFLFAPRADFLDIKTPSALGAVIGDTLEISTAHTFTAPAGFLSWDTQQHSVVLTGASVGEDGAKEIEWTAKFNVIGDSASTQEQLSKLLNDDIIALVKESDCLVSDSYVQLGDECVSPSFSVEFNSNNTKEGKKVYNVTMVCKKKFFYTGTVTMAS